MNGHPAYKAILDRMWELHDSKAKDYGSTGDPLANLRNGERFGMPAWKRCLVEADSAFYRLENYCNGRNPSLESAKNALMDTAAFCLLALLFVEEEERANKSAIYAKLLENQTGSNFEDAEPGGVYCVNPEWMGGSSDGDNGSKLNTKVLSELVRDSLEQMLKDEVWQEKRSSALNGFVTEFRASPANNPVTNPPWLADVGARMQETLEKAK